MNILNLRTSFNIDPPIKFLLRRKSIFPLIEEPLSTNKIKKDFMIKPLRNSAVCFMLALSSLFADRQEMQDLEIQKDSMENSFLQTSTQIEDPLNPLDQLGDSFLGFEGRKQKDYHGLESLVSYVRLYGSKFCGVKVEDKKIKPGALSSFDPNRKSQFYIGMGIDTDYHMYKEEAMNAFFFKRSAEILRRPFVELCPKLALGKQYVNSFLEMQVGFLKIPILFKDGNAVVISLRYGIGF